MTPTARLRPGFYVFPAVRSYWVPDIDDVPALASELLAGDSMMTLRRQLSRHDADERHAFLFFGGFEETIAGALRESSSRLPSAAPTLPAPIDGLWLTSDEPGARLIA